MAKNKIVIDVEVNGKMEKATISAKKLSKALESAENAHANLNTETTKGYRAAQGSAQNTSNSTKAFAKQAGVVNGLVPVYATFAANVFAVSAAFNVLRRAAAVESLTASLDEIGAASGRNLPALAQDLVNLTGAAVSAEASLRATAVATSSGFSQAQLLGLTKVAKGASLALGRDMGDALDRLVRGTAKLEPEILDELGIIVRLDKASSDYAITLGKTATQLTQFEKTQAFVNATITQGISKYDRIAKSIDPNPYDQLEASFQNLSKTMLNFANTAIAPIANFLATNQLALAGVLTVFAGTLVKQVTPAISEFTEQASKRFKYMSTEAKNSAARIKSSYAEAAKELQTLDFAPKGFKDIEPKIAAGSASAAELKKALKSLAISEGKRRTEITKLQAAQKGLRGEELKAHKAHILEKQAELAAIEKLTAATMRLQEIQMAGSARSVVGGGNVAAVERAAANQQRAAVGSRFERKMLNRIEGQGALGAVGTFFGSLPMFLKNAAQAEGAAGKLSEGFRGLASTGRLFGATLGKLIPFVGQLLFALEILSPIYDALFSKSEAQKSVDESIERFQVFTKTIKILNEEFANTSSQFSKTFSSLRASTGIFDEVASAITRLSSTSDEELQGKIRDNIEKLVKYEKMSQDDIEGVFSGLSATLEVENKKLFKLLGGIDKDQAAILVRSAAASIGGAEGVLPGVTSKFEQIKKDLASGKFNVEGTDLIDSNALAAALRAPSEEAARFEGNIKSAQDAISGFSSEITKMANKQVTPFDAIIEKSVDIENSISSVYAQFGKEIGGGKAAKTPIDSLTEKFPEAIDQAEFLGKKLGFSVKTLGDLEFAQSVYNEDLKEANEILRDKQGILQKEQAKLEQLKKFQEAGSAVTKLVLSQEDAVLNAKEKALEAEKTLVERTLDGADLKNRTAQIDAQLVALGVQRKTEEAKNYDIIKAQIAEKQRSIDLAQKELSVLAEQNNIAKERADLNNQIASRLRGQDRFSFMSEDRNALKDQIATLEAERVRQADYIQKEASLKKAQQAAEYMLLDAKYAYLAAESRNAANKLRSAENATDADKKAAAELDKSVRALEALRTGLGASNITITAEGKVTGVPEGGVLSQIFGNIDDRAQLSVDQLSEKIKQLKAELRDMDTIEATFNAAAKSFSDNFGSAIASIMEGTASVKDAFGSLAISILRSMQKVLLDRVTEDFVGFLADKSEGTIFNRLFKKSEGAQPATTPETGVAALAQQGTNPMQAGIPGMSGALGVLGSSPTNPMYVVMVQDPLANVMATMPAAVPGQAPAGPEAAMGALSGMGAPTEEEKQKTQEGLLDSLKALDTTTLATGAAITGLIGATMGNTKAGQFLTKVSMLLQTAILAQTIWDKFMGPIEQSGTTANTAALAANTVALYASAAAGLARTGGVFSNGQKVKGYATGGIAKGSIGGYPTILHGTEAVVPLPNGRSIPVEVSGQGGGMNQNNVNVNVVMNSDGTATTSTEEDGRRAGELGKNIAFLVQEELKRQKRAGGMLSPYGVG